MSSRWSGQLVWGLAQVHELLGELMHSCGADARQDLCLLHHRLLETVNELEEMMATVDPERFAEADDGELHPKCVEEPSDDRGERGGRHAVAAEPDQSPSGDDTISDGGGERHGDAAAGARDDRTN